MLEGELMKKFSVMFLVIFIIGGCSLNVYHYNIEDDMGNLMDTSTSKIFDDISFIVLVDDYHNKEITINDFNEINYIVQVIINGKEKISDDINWVGSLIHLNFYNSNDSLIAVIDVHLAFIEDYEYSYVSIDSYDSFIGVYYTDTFKVKELLRNYIIDFE